ncbi:MAG: SRPBCC domain-containing protein [Betaproteobacteria bacterium]|nr:SRPBCC domain-containing protein [Betaproteobacteria bacterium]
MTRTDTSGTLGVLVTREFRAAPETVFDAFTDPEQQKIWLSALGPQGGEVTTSVDLRVGGVWEATFRANPDTLVHDVPTSTSPVRTAWSPH